MLRHVDPKFEFVDAQTCIPHLPSSLLYVRKDFLVVIAALEWSVEILLWT